MPRRKRDWQNSSDQSSATKDVLDHVLEGSLWRRRGKADAAAGTGGDKLTIQLLHRLLILSRFMRRDRHSPPLPRLHAFEFNVPFELAFRIV